MPGLLEKQWLRYSAILPKDASEEQRIETKRAFFGGIAALTTIQLDIIAPLPEPLAVIMMVGIEKELAAFAEAVKAGKA